MGSLPLFTTEFLLIFFYPFFTMHPWDPCSFLRRHFFPLRASWDPWFFFGVVNRTTSRFWCGSRVHPVPTSACVCFGRYCHSTLSTTTTCLLFAALWHCHTTTAVLLLAALPHHHRGSLACCPLGTATAPPRFSCLLPFGNTIEALLSTLVGLVFSSLVYLFAYPPNIMYGLRLVVELLSSHSFIPSPSAPWMHAGRVSVLAKPRHTRLPLSTRPETLVLGG